MNQPMLRRWRFHRMTRTKGLTLLLEHVEIILAYAEEREEQRRRLGLPLSAEHADALRTVRREVEQVKAPG